MSKKRNNKVVAVKKIPDKINQRYEKEPQLVVGIGASAGGLEAFSQLLKTLPNDTGMSFILIQHLEPKRESKLSEILSSVTTMQVTQVKQSTGIKPNNIYVIPPNKYLSIKNERLNLSPREKSHGLYLPVNYFFQSLAKEKKNKAIGIILSGSASDGTEGLRAIKAEGGLTFAQDRESAKYDGMPSSAADSGNADIILPPERIAAELIRIAKHPYIAFHPEHKEEEPDIRKDDFYSNIFRLLRNSTGVDFTYYKTPTIKRRISRRMVINKIHSPDKYVKLLNDNKDEIQELYKDLLINVTSFFRDPEVFEVLKDKIFPELVSNKTNDNPVRIWVPGCSTGEEVYSIAISLKEYLGKKSDINVQIFSTDISDASIDKARTGIYPASSVEDMPPELIKKYFTKTNGNYQVNKSVREVCVFARQDISKDPPFSKIDLISCRNLLIYLSSELQKKIIPVFHYALNQKGFLLLGSSESIGTFANLFDLYEKKHRVYRKKDAQSHYDYRFSFRDHQPEKLKESGNKDISGSLDIQKEADKILLNQYGPAGLLVNSSLEIISFRGKVNQYLEPSAGDASLNLFKMIRQDLNLELHTAFRKVKKSSEKVVVENVKVRKNGSQKIIDIELLPVKTSYESNEVFYMVVFREKNTADEKEKKKPGKESAGKTESESRRYSKLKEDLLIAKEHLQSIIEEREAANEELRSTLEELQSSNEELQSTNEEMETAREELQSTNEELITVNDELENRNMALGEINNDLLNLLASINQPIIMLDRDLRIKRFTAKAEIIWNLIPSDIGRPINNLKPNVDIPDLKEKILEVMDDLDSKEFEVKGNDDKWYSVKIRPYKTTESKINGVVIILYDINKIKSDSEAAFESNEFSEAVLNTMRESLLILKNDLRVVSANKSFFKSFNVLEKDTVGKYIYDLGNGQWNIPSLKKLLEEIVPENSVFEDYEVQHNFLKVGRKKMILNARKIYGNSEREELILLAIEEVK